MTAAETGQQWLAVDCHCSSGGIPTGVARAPWLPGVKESPGLNPSVSQGLQLRIHRCLRGWNDLVDASL
jgi:hypothetical protein